MEFRAHEMGGSPCALQICWHFRRIALSPAFAGLIIFCAYLPGACAPGFMRQPAPQAKTDSRAKPLVPRTLSDISSMGNFWLAKNGFGDWARRCLVAVSVSTCWPRILQ